MLRYMIYSVWLNARFGMGYIGPPLFIKGYRKICIGQDFRLFPGARLEVLGDGQLIVGDFFRGGHNFFATCSDENISIGDYCIVSANVFVGTQKNDFSKSVNDKMWFKDNVSEHSVFIGDRCFLGYGAVILPGTVLGDGCVVGANAVVSGEYKAGSVIATPKATEISG